MKKLALISALVVLCMLALSAGVVMSQDSATVPTVPGQNSNPRVEIDKQFKRVINERGRGVVERKLEALPANCAQVEPGKYFTVTFDEECTPKVENTLDSLEATP